MQHSVSGTCAVTSIRIAAILWPGRYAVGSVSGPAFRDTVTIGDARANAQIIGAANVTQGFSVVKPIDGIREALSFLTSVFSPLMPRTVGLGPSGGNTGDVSGLNATPTFVETLVAQGSIDAPIFGIFISPVGENGVPERTGELTFGGVDDTRISGELGTGTHPCRVSAADPATEATSHGSRKPRP